MRRLHIHIARRRLIVGLLTVVLIGALPLISRTCFVSHRSQKDSSALSVAGLSRESTPSRNPEMLLAEANRLAWLTNWPGAGPNYSRAEELFTKEGDTRNAIYARVGRIRA